MMGISTLILLAMATTRHNGTSTNVIIGIIKKLAMNDMIGKDEKVIAIIGSVTTLINNCNFTVCASLPKMVAFADNLKRHKKSVITNTTIKLSQKLMPNIANGNKTKKLVSSNNKMFGILIKFRSYYI